MLDNVVILKRANRQFQSICEYIYRSKIVGKHNKMYYFVRGNTLVIAAFADMRMHPNKIMKIVKG